ncbi:MAG: ATP-binding protein, partial [Gallionellaceae bacterium]|nr:ATP-binding protein [Gallionellaceae bacterium]
PAFDAEGHFIGHRASNRDITERKKIDKTMQALATTFSELAGTPFFDAICHHLADTLGIDYVFIGKFEASLNRVNVIGGYAMGRPMGELSYELSDTPCANVVGKSACFYPSNLQVLFPKDRLLADMGIESYAGIPIFDKLRSPIGILVALHTRPLSGSQSIIDFLQVFSDRVAAEMQRSDTEEALRQANQELQLHVQERTEALQAAKTAAEVAKAASCAKSAFLANMSHELRTPMNHIMGMTALALRSAADPKQQDQLQKVGAAAQHLLELINDILDLSKIEAERLTIECIDFNLGEVIGNLKNIVGQKATDKGLAFRIDIPDTLVGQLLNGDPLRLAQILINLTGNAVKFTQAGHVIVRARARDEFPAEIVLRFEVEDTGIGISAEDQKRLFQAFEQADNSMTRKYGGSGLGLAICKRLTQMMGGEIGVKSDPGQGSTFWFTVRLGKGSAVALEPIAAKGLSAKEQLQARHSNMRILVVDDDPINMMVTQDMLEQVGMRSDAAIDGYEAVVMAQEYPYDLILMDMQMPVLNGLDATRAIRMDSLNLKTPIVAMTANVFEEDKRACLDAGMCDHVAKPFLPEQLYEAILRWLDQPNLKVE